MAQGALTVFFFVQRLNSTIQSMFSQFVDSDLSTGSAMRPLKNCINLTAQRYLTYQGYIV